MKYVIKKGLKISDITNFNNQNLFCEWYHLKSFAVDFNLNVYKCVETYNDDTKIGMITNDGIILKQISKFYIKDSCLNCKILPYCNGGYAIKRDKNQTPCPVEKKELANYIKFFFSLNNND